MSLMSPLMDVPEEDAPSTRRYRPGELRESGAASLPLEAGGFYVVTIFYREPGYATHENAEAKTYSGSFTVRARDRGEAIRKARTAFYEVAKASSVGWVREITEIVCRPASPAI